MTSYYEASARRDPPAPPLRGPVRADVCIIGGGYTGLMAALVLAEHGARARLIEAGLIAQGASGRNGGQVGSGQRRAQRWLEAQYGPERAHAYWRISQEAKALVKRRIAQHDIACDATPGILTAAHRADLVRGLAEEAEHLAQHYGYDQIQLLSKAELGARLDTAAYHGGTLDRGALHVHPLNYALGLARAARAAGAIIHENTAARTVDVEHGRVATDDGEIHADHIVIACNGYLGGLVPPIAPYIMPINNFIVATEPLGARAQTLIRDRFAVADTRFVIRYFRLSADDRLLFGGGESYSPHMPDHVETMVRPHMLDVFPQLKATRIDYAWGGTLAITFSRMPHLGRLGKRGYFAQGLSGHGVAMAGMSGQLMADAILGESEDFAQMTALGVPAFPGGTILRNPLRIAAMIYGKLRDAL